MFLKIYFIKIQCTYKKRHPFKVCQSINCDTHTLVKLHHGENADHVHHPRRLPHAPLPLPRPSASAPDIPGLLSHIIDMFACS